MRKHPLVKNMRKLNFHLVPVKGAVKANGGKFRAEIFCYNTANDSLSREQL